MIFVSWRGLSGSTTAFLVRFVALSKHPSTVMDCLFAMFCTNSSSTIRRDPTNVHVSGVMRKVPVPAFWISILAFVAPPSYQLRKSIYQPRTAEVT